MSLDELMNGTVKVVPEGLWTCTPVRAIAGLRLLGKKQSKDILDAVSNRLRDKYEFNLDDVFIMGKDCRTAVQLQR